MLSLINLDRLDQIDEIIEQSMNPKIKGVFVFKHSTKCGTSRMALSQLSNHWNLDDSYPVYYLDIFKNRNISNELASRFRVIHESPQLLYISDGALVNHTSHWDINIERVGIVCE